MHIPFCQHKCAYCDFNSYAGLGRDEQERYVAALLAEMDLWAARPELRGEQVATVFVAAARPPSWRGGCWRAC